MEKLETGGALGAWGVKKLVTPEMMFEKKFMGGLLLSPKGLLHEVRNRSFERL